MNKKETIKKFNNGEWVDSESVQNALNMSFKECLSKFDFSRTAEWWSISGKTEKEIRMDRRLFVILD